MKYYDQQPGMYRLQKGWKFLETTEKDTEAGQSHNLIYGYAKGDGAKGPAGCVFDDSEWESVELPHDWVTKKDFDQENGNPSHGYKVRGKAWYRLHFALPEEAKGRQILLEFEGMSRDARVFINGSFVHISVSGYHPFCIDITDMAIFDLRGNVLAIEIDASAWEGWWYEGAGIYRDAWLIIKDKLHVEYDGLYIKPVRQANGSWVTEVQAELANSLGGKEEASVTALIFDPDGKQIAEETKTIEVEGYDGATVNFSFDTDPVRLWDIDTPQRYRCEVRVGRLGKTVDYLKEYYGYRTIRFDADTGFWLNGRNEKLKGFCNHQDHTGIGVAVPYAVKEYRIRLLKEIGANAYRCAHNTDPEILDICDRLGMLVMEENRAFRTSEEVLRHLRSMVKKARNHPSVILYSLFNEEPLQGTEQGARMVQRMTAEIHRLDATRYTTAAMNGGYMEDGGASGVLDVTGINYHTKAYDEFHEKYPDRPLIASETVSAFMVRGEYETDPERNTASNYDDTRAGWGSSVRNGWKQVAIRPFVGGTFVWAGFDYRGEPTPYRWPSVATFFGTYDSCGFKKDCCYLYRAFWTKEPMIHVLPDWDRPVAEGTAVRVMAFTNCEEAEIFVNGKSMGRRRCDPFDQVSWEVPYAMGTLLAVGYNKGEKAAEDRQVTPGAMTGLRLSLSKDKMAHDFKDTVVVNAEAVDAFGNFVPSADALVSFQAEGGAKIIGVGNGNPNSHEPDVASYRHMFHGRCQALLKNCNGEDVVIRACAEHMAGDELSIAVYEVPVIPNIEIVEDEIIRGWCLKNTLYDSMPDPNPVVSDQDMNSFEPVTFEGSPQAAFSGKVGKYGLYRTEHDFGQAAAGRVLFGGALLGKAWFYIDGKQIGEPQTRMVHIAIPDALSGKHVLTVILVQEDAKIYAAGIKSPLVIRK